MAVAKAAGGYALFQDHIVPSNSPSMWESAESALIIARSPEALAHYAADPRWQPSRPDLVRPWTDDYTNLVGAMMRRIGERPVFANLKDLLDGK